MSKEQQLSHRSGGNDKDCHFTTTKHFHRGDEETDEESDKEIEEDTIKISKAQDTSLAPSGLINMIDTFDRPGRAMPRAEVASASTKAGPVGVKVGLGFDTGASAGADGVEVKVLGTGIKIGPKPSVSVLGSEVSCSVM